MSEITETRELECDLTQEDRNDYTKELTDSIIEKSEVEEEKKQAVKAYNKDIKDLGKKITRLGMMLDNGFVHRDISCRIEHNTPRYGKKTITRKDTWESWVEEMSDEEFNLFNNQSKAEEQEPQENEERSASIREMMS